MADAGVFEVIDLGRMAYAPALERQRGFVDRVLADRAERGDARTSAGFLLLVEHDPPVITVSKRATATTNLLVAEDQLARLGVEVQPTDRGGDITYHGPGQLVVYPILDLNLLRLRLHDYIRTLEEGVIRVCASFGVDAIRDDKATGVWIPDDEGAPRRKICAMGVRVKRWVSMHGLALNVTTNLAHFDLIVPCGLPGRPVTSLANERADAGITMDRVKRAMTRELAELFGARLSRGSSAPDPARR